MINITYNRNIIAPRHFVIFHLLKAIVNTTANNIRNNNIVEQNSPSLETTTAFKLFEKLLIIHGNGNLEEEKNNTSICNHQINSFMTEVPII